MGDSSEPAAALGRGRAAAPGRGRAAAGSQGAGLAAAAGLTGQLAQHGSLRRSRHLSQLLGIYEDRDPVSCL